MVNYKGSLTKVTDKRGTIMNKLKDILYDKNDLLVVVVILAIAALIIFNRVDAIMAYPQTMLAENEADKDEPVLSSDLTGNEDPQNPNTDENKPADAPSNGEGVDKNTDQTPADSSNVNYSVYIEAGSTGLKIAQTLVDCGLIKDKAAFINAVTAASAENKLKAGNFIVPAGSTPAQIVQILTK